ncbi:MAG: tRNA lysidine(34) synthetase TilS [Clostridia bacterium]|nr:tRNA lysidine(34) synthetase TilS [Clostridia bacterium]
MNALMTAVREALSLASLWRDDAALLIGVSGGCDSVALLHAVCGLRDQRRLHIHAVHVQHGLRGEDSLADERFVRQLCEELNVPLSVCSANLTGDMHTPGMETLARDSRRQIFARLLDEHQLDALLTAHHRDDQTETVLMHLLRGSGMQGLCGMQTVSAFAGRLLIRPFLNLPKAQLRAALEQHDLPFREDASNQECLTPRNTLRLSVLPELERLFPGAGEHIAQTAALLSEDECFLSDAASRLYHQIHYAAAPLYMLPVQPLLEAPEAIRRRVLRQWYMDGLQTAQLTAQERALSYQDTLALAALMHEPAGSRLNLPCGLMAAREEHWLHLVRQSGEPLQGAAGYSHPVTSDAQRFDLPHLTLTAAKPGHLPRDARSVILPPDMLSQSPVLRLPQPGDTIRPFGAPGHKPLRRYLTDRKIDPFLRRAWPMLCIGSEVLWIPGLCAAEATRLDHLPTDGIQLTVTGDTPFVPNPPKE